ncbi:hypothetical protein CHARACLAT_011653 [Characodon lateralis]|uniref:Uncharacterized protein n=1 Tax=Characodon lateralis TaxID=208331 RepID=A0ABU7D078_9TELE|nr:hypothetical protein [Characodon lateralis]
MLTGPADMSLIIYPQVLRVSLFRDVQNRQSFLRVHAVPTAATRRRRCLSLLSPVHLNGKWTGSFQSHLNPAEEFLSQTLMRGRGRWRPGKFQHECVLMSVMKSPTQFLGRYPHMSLFRTRPGQRQTMRRVSGEILPFR